MCLVSLLVVVGPSQSIFIVSFYGSGRDHIFPRLDRIYIYRPLYMLLHCGFMIVFYSIFITIDIHTVLHSLCHIRLCMRVLSAIFLDQLESMSLSALNSSFIFPSGICIQTSAFQDFCGLYLLSHTHYLDLVNVSSSPFNLFKGVYPH